MQILDASKLNKKKDLAFLGIVNVNVAECDLTNHGQSAAFDQAFFSAYPYASLPLRPFPLVSTFPAVSPRVGAFVTLLDAPSRSSLLRPRLTLTLYSPFCLPNCSAPIRTVHSSHPIVRL